MPYSSSPSSSSSLAAPSSYHGPRSEGRGVAGTQKEIPGTELLLLSAKHRTSLKLPYLKFGTLRYIRVCVCVCYTREGGLHDAL